MHGSGPVVPMGVCGSKSSSTTAKDVKVEESYSGGRESIPDMAFTSIGWEGEDPFAKDDSEDDAEPDHNPRNSTAERLQADAVARAQRSRERAAAREAQRQAQQQAAAKAQQNSPAAQETSEEGGCAPSNADTAVDSNEPPLGSSPGSSPAVQFLSRNSIVDLVETQGFAMAAKVASERRRSVL